jgi:hypothetical protein
MKSMTFVIANCLNCVQIYTVIVKGVIMEIRKHIVRTIGYRVAVERNYRKLEILKAQDSTRAFYALFVSAIPELSKYVEMRLKEMEIQGKILSNFYKKEDFIDELFIAIYSFFGSIKSEDQFYIFLFKALNTLMENVRAKENNLNESLEDIEIYAKSERDKTREKLASQLDGDMILEEELEDISYAPYKDDIKTIFELESEKEMVENIDSQLIHLLTSKEVDEFIDSLPQSHSNIATLYMFFHLTIPEIVPITKDSRNQVRRVIKNVKEELKNNFV